MSEQTNICPLLTQHAPILEEKNSLQPCIETKCALYDTEAGKCALVVISETIQQGV